MIMSANIKKESQRMTGQSMPGTQTSSRADVYIKEEVDEEAIKEESKRMDEMMRRLMGGDDDEESESAEEPEDMEEVKEEEEDAFSFRLFASQPVATVKIIDEVDNTNDWAKAVADQQVYEFDETDPEFVVRAKAAAIDYKTIIKQSSIPYPALRQARRVVHVTASGDIVNKETSEKKTAKKRKSKKCRDFEKAVKEGKIDLKPNMRNPNTPDGWPGWPGNLTRVAIVDYDSGKKKRGGNNHSRGDGFKARGDSRGGRGGMMSRGRGRGRSF